MPSREAEKLVARGHEAVVAPLLDIEFLSDVPLGLAGAQALIATSGNALRALALHPARDEARKLPLLAVGDATASEAQALDFADVTIGPGTGSKLAELIVNEFEPQRGALVHLSGEAIAFDLKAVLETQGFTVRRVVLYRALPAERAAGPSLEPAQGRPTRWRHSDVAAHRRDLRSAGDQHGRW